MRHSALDIAVIIARHIGIDGWSPQRAAAHLSTAVDPRQPGIHPQSELKDQLCVPVVAQRWAWWRSRSTVAPARVLGMISSKPLG